MARELTEKQQLFLEHLFGEAAGNAYQAKILAGYEPATPTSQIVKSLESEIIDRTKLFLAQNGPKAALSVTSLLDDPTQLGANFRLMAAKDVLDRIGITKTEKVEVGGGVFILPPKNEG